MINCKSKNIACALAAVPAHLQTKSQSILDISKNLVFADTTVATISGKIYGESIYSDEPFQQEDILPFTNITLTNTETKEVLGITTDLDGAYNLSVPTATYQFQISFIGYNIVTIENLQLGTGEILNLSAQLGLGIDEEEFIIINHQDTKELVRKTN
ncbi:carboxypeptidase regulatory-like domain protein [Kordia sp. SMS9]|uniref:carboxypeptidase-like regulatory domain-containing protein n=1 Tax=Kordia sp. SMS9 TaxID=2282170 RepID=UPI000E0DC861|nr:carboxypeptidase-like regulatory domain-containing protein [Kordia sp. SMS9]AXG69979.1 carboxypeptidase regulatory-like domain protein [Kordia sp. SMS9]